MANLDDNKKNNYYLVTDGDTPVHRFFVDVPCDIDASERINYILLRVNLYALKELKNDYKTAHVIFKENCKNFDLKHIMKSLNEDEQWFVKKHLRDNK